MLCAEAMSTRVRCPCPRHVGGKRVSAETRRRCKLAYPASFAHWASEPAASSTAAAAAAAAGFNFPGVDSLDDDAAWDGGDVEWREDEEQEKQSVIATTGERTSRHAPCNTAATGRQQLAPRTKAHLRSFARVAFGSTVFSDCRRRGGRDRSHI